jgi:glycosyltransferase involved in cell wall biosynthesis
MKAYRERVNRVVAEQSLQDQVVWAGRLKEEELDWCFDNCRAFIMTSRAEACPNIALEAMSYGCSIISTTQPPMPEFFLNSALYYEPHAPSLLADQVLELLSLPADDVMRRRTLARQRAAEFRWPDTATGTVRQLQMACRGSLDYEQDGVRS